jgi:hypothetical protein
MELEDLQVEKHVLKILPKIARASLFPYTALHVVWFISTFFL